MRSGWFLFCCALALLIDGYDVQAMGLAIPSIALELELKPQAFGGIVTAGLFGMAIGAMVLAPRADRIGRTRAMVWALLLIGTATIMITFLHSLAAMTASRFVAGLGLGALLPITLAAAAEVARPQRRTLVLTLIASCAGVGSLFAGLIAPMLEVLVGWRGLFYAGAVLPLLPMVGLLFAGDPGVEGANGNKSVRPTYGRAVAELLAPEMRQKTVLIWLIFFASLFATYSLISWLPTLLTLAGWEHSAAQQATALLALGGVAGGLVIAWLADRGLAKQALGIAYLTGAAAFIGLGTIPESAQLTLVLLTLTGACGIGSQLALGSLLASIYPTHVHATAMGWGGGFGRIGSILGPGVFTLLIASGASTSLMLGLLTVPMIVCVGAVARIPASGSAK